MNIGIQPHATGIKLSDAEGNYVLCAYGDDLDGLTRATKFARTCLLRGNANLTHRIHEFTRGTFTLGIAVVERRGRPPSVDLWGVVGGRVQFHWSFHGEGLARLELAIDRVLGVEVPPPSGGHRAGIDVQVAA